MSHQGKTGGLVTRLLVGLQWGNDPTIKTDTYTQISFTTPPDKTKISPRLKETVINDDPDELPPTHLGWDGRLNGPVDDPISSCMSCHMTAEFPSYAMLSPAFQQNPPRRGSAYWMRWFQNVDCTVPFGNYLAPDGKPQTGINPMSTDFSLQLSISIVNFCDANPHAPVCDQAANILGGAAKRVRPKRAPRAVVRPIIRDLPDPRPRQR